MKNFISFETDSNLSEVEISRHRSESLSKLTEDFAESYYFSIIDEDDENTSMWDLCKIKDNKVELWEYKTNIYFFEEGELMYEFLETLEDKSYEEFTDGAKEAIKQYCTENKTDKAAEYLKFQYLRKKLPELEGIFD